MVDCSKVIVEIVRAGMDLLGGAPLLTQAWQRGIQKSTDSLSTF